MSNSLRLHGLQHTRCPCPSLFPRICSNSSPLSWWCHPTISSSVIPFSSCLQSFQASGPFPMSWLFASGGLSIAASASASALPMNIQYWPVWSPCSSRDSWESSPVPQFESTSSLVLILLFVSTLTSIDDYWKNHSFDYMDLCWQSVRAKLYLYAVLPSLRNSCYETTLAELNSTCSLLADLHSVSESGSP